MNDKKMIFFIQLIGSYAFVLYGFVVNGLSYEVRVFSIFIGLLIMMVAFIEYYKGDKK